MQIVAVYAGYFWISALHATFVGVTLYAFWGKRLIKYHPSVSTLVALPVLAFFELYWKPFFNFLDIRIVTESREIQQHFGIIAPQNLVDAIPINPFFVTMWLLQAYLASIIGRKTYTNLTKTTQIQ